MKAKTIEIIGTLIEERRPSGCGTFFLGKIRPIVDGEVDTTRIINIVGNAEEDDLKLHMTYRWYGEWKKHEKYGDQFAFSTFGNHKPHGRTGVVKYLQECPHIGEQTAIQLWNLFNADAVRICRTAPELVAEKVPRLSLAKCEEIAKKLKEMSAVENLSIEAMDLFTGRGFPKKTAQYAIKTWGAKAIEIVTRDPFKLRRFRGIGFKKCDSMWQDLGLPLNKLKRQVYCILHAIESGTNGDVWYSADTIRQNLQNSMPAGVEVDFDRAVKLAVRAKMISEKSWCDKCGNTGSTEQPDFFFGDEMIQGPCPVCEFGQTVPRWLSLRKEAEAEEFIARHLVDALKETPRWPVLEETPEGMVGPSKHQIEELRKALTSTLCILHGSPGTGKTFTFGYLAKAIIAQFGENSIAGAAPTGIAAQRMREALAAAGCNVVVKTHHGLLGVEEADDGVWVFKHNERKPLPYQFLFLDEQSMDDAMIFASLLKARAKGTHVLFIGDIHQLPPVGTGAPLRDMMKAGIACGNLTEIRRNAGTIVRACAQIRDGKPFDIDKEFDLNPVCPTCENTTELNASGCETCGGTGKLPPKNLILVPAGKAQAAAAVYSTVGKLKEQGIDPVWQAQTIIAVNKKSPLSRSTVNTRLQEMLNPGGKTVPNSPFRENDKTICLKNSMFKKHGESGDDATKYPIANGELGKVLIVAEKLTVIESYNPKRVYDVFRNATTAKKPETDEAEDGKDDTSSNTGCDIELAYAITSHKSQGAQFDYVIVALDEYPGAVGPRGICKREWLYTAISRAKIGCILVGLRSTALAMIAETALDKRKTFLAELIKKYREEDQHWQKNTLEGTCSTVTTAESTPSTPKKPARLNWMATGAFKVTSPMT